MAKENRQEKECVESQIAEVTRMLEEMPEYMQLERISMTAHLEALRDKASGEEPPSARALEHTNEAEAVEPVDADDLPAFVML